MGNPFKAALDQDLEKLESMLLSEEKVEKEKDQAYWRPLREELEQWRKHRTR